MTIPPPPFVVEVIDFAIGRDDLQAIREVVFVQEQQVPAEMERDALDPQCVHVIARSADGMAIGTGRLTPDHRIGRMAVLRDWRGKGVGDAMLLALIDQARERGWREVALNAQASAITFYARHGFLPHGERFMEAGIEHLAMRRLLAGANAIEDHAAAVVTTRALIGAARRGLWIYSRNLDPGLFDAPEVLDAFRSFATAGVGGEARILLQDAAAPQRAHAPLLELAQRLPSVFLFREPIDPVDRAYASAYLANDNGGYYFRSLGHRLEGEADLHGPGRARQLRNAFEQVWERSRPVTEYRALGI
jgi:predicted GNAT family N-acyltransferase